LLGFLKSSVVSLDEKHILQELKILMPQSALSHIHKASVLKEATVKG
jgi:hypothetical protein